MILERVEVKDYKSISNLEWDLNERLSCLVGQNESGKSNLLQLFEYLDSKKAKLLNYENHTTRSSESYVQQELPKILYYFIMSSDRKKEFLSLLKSHNVVSDFFNEKGELYYIMEVDEKETNYYKGLFRSEGKDLALKSLKVYGPPLPPQASGMNRNESPIPPKIITVIQSFIDESITRIVKLEDNFKIVYEATIEDLRSGASNNTTLFRLLNIAGLKDKGKLPSGKTQLKQYLRRLNKELGKNFVQKYYSQDDSIKLEFVHDSGAIYLEIEDNTEASYQMEERSDGFKYFFSLLVEMASHNAGNTDTIFLLDEPGLKLHPSGQRDLLKYLEDMSENHRIIYTTHSPFLINRLYPNRVRIVARDLEKGTVFKFKGFSKNWKPMRSSLGLNIKDSFYYSDKALIVEGPEDLIFISSLIEYFNRIGELDLNTDLFSFIDAGGESNLPAMVQIIMDDERPTLVLIDSDSESTYNKLNKKVAAVSDAAVLDLIQVNDFRKEAVSIEDLLPYQLLQDAVKLFCAELESDGTLKKKKPTSDGQDASAIATAVMAVASEVASSIATLPIDLSKVNYSRYNTSIAQTVKNFYTEVDLDEDKWNNKKTPISKVGIARHFEILLQDDKIDKSKMDFKPSLKLVKAIATKLGLLN